MSLSNLESIHGYLIHKRIATLCKYRWFNCCPCLGNLERYPSLQRLEGLKALIKPPNRTMIEGIVYELILPSKMLRHGINRPILVLHPTKEFMEKVLHIRDLSAMFVISYDKPN